MKYPLALTLLACVALPTIGQTPSAPSTSAPCTLTRAQAPEIRSIRLGMTAEQLKAVFPERRVEIDAAVRSSQRADAYGAGRFDVPINQQSVDPRFTGVNFISVDLLDERVTAFSVAYVGPEWKNVDQFVAKLSEALRLPISPWDRKFGKQQSLTCDGFKIDAYASGENADSWVRLQDTAAPQVVEQRREAAREKKRQDFKP